MRRQSPLKLVEMNKYIYIWLIKLYIQQGVSKGNRKPNQYSMKRNEVNHVIPYITCSQLEAYRQCLSYYSRALSLLFCVCRRVEHCHHLLKKVCFHFIHTRPSYIRDDVWIKSNVTKAWVVLWHFITRKGHLWENSER